jgi:uncharacterized protein (TIGR02246 family)
MLRRTLSVIVPALLITPCVLPAQSSNAEREVRAFIAAYDKAVAARDVAFLERVLPHDYVFTGASGRKSDRAQVLRYHTRQREQPSYRRVSLIHDEMQVRVVGSMAVLTNHYMSKTVPVNAPDAEPDSVSGRHTGVFEKRNGRWMVIAEQDTEHARDDKLMERQVAAAGRAYVALTQRLHDGRGAAQLDRDGDVAALKRLFTEKYTGTWGDSVITSLAEEVQRHTRGTLRLTSAELTDQRVLAIDNSAAIETGSVRYRGTLAGQPYDVTRRFTRTWVSWGEGWQIITQQASAVTP